MLNLLSTFSVEQIILYTVMLVLAIKGAIDFGGWCYNQYKIKFNKDHDAINKQNTLEEHYKNCINQHKESIIRYEEINNKIDVLTKSMDEKVNQIEDKIDQLTISNMHDIKGWIVDKHHVLMKRGWVDDFTMDILEKRFSDYKEEGGNSYVGGLMEELRALPHTIPEGEE